MMTFLPFPESLEPYSGCPGTEWLFTWLRTWQIIFVVLTRKCRKDLSMTIDSIHSSGWNYNSNLVQEQNFCGLKRGLTPSTTFDATSDTVPGSLNRGNATVKSSPFFP